METTREPITIGTVVEPLFNAYRHDPNVVAVRAALNVDKTIETFSLEHYQIEFSDETRVMGAITRGPTIALNSLAKDFGLSSEILGFY